MILAPLFGVALVVTVATEPLTAPLGSAALSTQQKNSAMEPLVRSATDCIVHAVTTDPHFETASAGAIGDMIVASMPSCVTPVRAMIDNYDRYFGEGTGRSLFHGPVPRRSAEGGIRVGKKGGHRQRRDQQGGRITAPAYATTESCGRGKAGRNAAESGSVSSTIAATTSNAAGHAERVADEAVERRRERARADGAGIEHAEARGRDARARPDRAPSRRAPTRCR